MYVRTKTFSYSLCNIFVPTETNAEISCLWHGKSFESCEPRDRSKTKQTGMQCMWNVPLNRRREDEDDESVPSLHHSKRLGFSRACSAKSHFGLSTCALCLCEICYIHLLWSRSQDGPNQHTYVEQSSGRATTLLHRTHHIRQPPKKTVTQKN